MSLELKRKEIELIRVNVARQELELKVEEKMEDIQKLKEMIKAQIDAEDKIKVEIEKLK
jgi:hypothetical protein